MDAVGDEPRDLDKSILVIILCLIGISFIFIGLILHLTKQDITQTLATLFLGTFTIIATFQNEIKNIWNRPKFKLTFGSGQEPFFIKNNNMIYIRGKLRNFGRGSAEDCFIRVNQVLKENASVAIGDLPLNLKWSSANVNSLTNSYEKKESIPPKGARVFFDLLTIEENQIDPILLVGGEESWRPYTMYLLGNKNEPRFLEMGKENYIVYITIHANKNYSKDFVLKIINSDIPENIKIRDVTYEDWKKSN